MCRAFVAVAMVSGALWLASCDWTGKPADDGRREKAEVVARVGAVKITTVDLNKAFDRYQVTLRLDEPGHSVKNKNIRKDFLYRLIDQTLLSIEAKREGITVTDEELEREIDSLLKNYDKSRLELALAKTELSFGSWKRGVERNLEFEKLTRQAMEGKLEIDKNEIKKFYRENTAKFKWPERVHVLQIMVTDETTAEEIRRKLLNNGHFTAIAKERSQSPDAVNGGDLGFFSRGQLPPEFENAVFNLKVGQISEVIESIYGFHLFKVIKKEKPRAMSYEEARERIRRALLEEKREKEFRIWIDSLRKKTPIVIDKKVLARLYS